MRVDAIRRRKRKTRARRISAYRRGDRVILPGGQSGTLIRRMNDWQYWMINVESETLPQAYTDKELRPA
jgi:preprotein translocase subunit YajC